MSGTKIIKQEMLLREIIDCESTYNQTPEGKANVKTADNANGYIRQRYCISRLSTIKHLD